MLRNTPQGDGVCLSSGDGAVVDEDGLRMLLIAMADDDAEVAEEAAATLELLSGQPLMPIIRSVLIPGWHASLN